MSKSGVRSTSDLSTFDWPTDSGVLSSKSLPVRIYFDSNTQKDKKNMNEYFRVYSDSAILNRVLEFPATLLICICLRIFWTSISCKNVVAPSFAKVTRLYLIDDIIKNKLAPKWRHASPCSDLSTNKSLVVELLSEQIQENTSFDFTSMKFTPYMTHDT